MVMLYALLIVCGIVSIVISFFELLYYYQHEDSTLPLPFHTFREIIENDNLNVFGKILGELILLILLPLTAIVSCLYYLSHLKK